MPDLNPTKLILGVLTPFVSAASAWLVAAAAKYGVHLDPSGVNALGVAGATAGAAAMMKLIHDVEGAPKVAAVVQTVEKDASGVAGQVERADPGAKALVDGAVAEASRVLQQQFNDFVAGLPQPSAGPAPDAPASPPVPVAPAVAAVAPAPEPPAA